MTEVPTVVDPAIDAALQARSGGDGPPRVDVVVELAPVEIPEGAGDPAARLVDHERRVRALQQDLLEHLDRLGVSGSPRPLSLVNAVVCSLTGDEVGSVAARSDVRRLTLAAAKHVTTEPP